MKISGCLKISSVDCLSGAKFPVKHRGGITKKMAKTFRVTEKIRERGPFGVSKVYCIEKIYKEGYQEFWTNIFVSQCRIILVGDPLVFLKISAVEKFNTYHEFWTIICLEKFRRRHLLLFVSTCPCFL